MAQGSWRDRPISPKQLRTIDNVVTEKVVSDLDETLLEILADVQSDVTITQGQASDLLDALFALPRKPRVFKEETAATLVSTWDDRKAKADAARVAYDAATEKAEAAKAAAGSAKPVGKCVECPHDGHTERCEAQVQSQWHDDWGYYQCGCKETKVGTEASAAAGVLFSEAAQLRRLCYDAQDEADKFVKGDWVVNVRGRKIPKGAKGQVVVAKYDGQYGPSLLLLLQDGTKVWTAMRNVEHIATSEV